MNQAADLPPALWQHTHDVHNVVTPLQDINLYRADVALQEAVQREGAAWADAELSRFGEMAGRASYLELGHLANQYPPKLDTHDRFGRRVDLVQFHPAYHELMRTALTHGLHASPWTHPRAGAHVARAAKTVMQSQVEAGHGCPITMTFAAVPSLRHQPDLAELWLPKITACDYDPRNVPIEQKSAITIGMGMTEKQGGSDVRANTTRATPIAAAGGGQLYQLVGHKWFLSAPMCDAFLVLAQTGKGLSCFLVPRWQPDGQKNPLEVVRLKNKMGNLSNASSEVEFRGALGWLVGEEGRGVATIIDMVGLTRFDCMSGSAAIMRMGLAQAHHHCQQRSAFGKRLIDQPLMQNVLADLALEYEGAIALTMRMARALDQRQHSEHDNLLARLGTAVGKYWICKRAPNHSYEAMECIGGNGVMEDSMMPRLYREAVINPIWEGSGNVQCLDVLRAMGKTPAVLDAMFSELERARGGHPDFDRALIRLQQQFADVSQLEYRARDIVDQLALALQAALLIQHAPHPVSDAFCRSRLGVYGLHNYGALPSGIDVSSLLARANPHQS